MVRDRELRVRKRKKGKIYLLKGGKVKFCLREENFGDNKGE